jgi:hypothetical protein
MKSIKFSLLIIPVLLFHSCCHQKECEEYIDSFELRNFMETEADSIILKIYQQDSNFTVLVDSIFTSAVHASYPPEKLIIPLHQGFRYELDYKIEMLSIGKTYLVSDFAKKRDECNSCFPWGHSYYGLLDKYHVNGTENISDGSGIVIEK